MACRGSPAGCMLGDGARGSASFDPQHAGAPFCDVICILSIATLMQAPGRRGCTMEIFQGVEFFMNPKKTIVKCAEKAVILGRTFFFFLFCLSAVKKSFPGPRIHDL